MKCITGGILIAAAEQAFAHSQLVQFPNHLFAQDVLLPTSAALLSVGTGFLVWGIVTECRGLATTAGTASKPNGNSE